MFIGIDVGAQHLDTAASHEAPRLPRRVPNTAEGIATLREALRGLRPELIVCEATGNYHRPLLAALLLAELPISVVNPAQIAAFRQSRLGRHKSDRSDAKLLARFAEVHHAELRLATPDEPELARLRQLVGYRDDLVAQATAARNRRHAATWAGSSAVLTSQQGVGLGVAAAVLAYLPPSVLGQPKAAAAYAGLHPRHEQSGQRDRSRLSKQGCPPLRRYLWLAALAAIRHDPEIAAWYQTLRGRGKATASATCAVAHKLLRRMMGRIRELRDQHPEELPMAA